MTDPATQVAEMITEHPSGDLLDGFNAALRFPWPVMTYAAFKRGVAIALELARADGRVPEDVE